MMKTLVVSPHLDDAVLSAFHLIGPETIVVTVFAGVPPRGFVSPWDRASGAEDSRTRLEERREEDRDALRATRARVVHLDFLDRQYVAMGAGAQPTEETVGAALREYVDGAAVVAVPAALSAGSRNPVRRWRRRHRPSDHRLVRNAVLALRPDALLYGDLPYALTPDRGFTLPREVRCPARREHRVTLSEEVVAAKLDSVACYRTQVPPLRELFGEFVNRADLGLEVVWELRSAV